MKHIKILIFVSLVFGFSSVYSQATKEVVKQSNLDKSTEQTDPIINSANQTLMVKPGEQIPASAQTPQLANQKVVDSRSKGVPAEKTAASTPESSTLSKKIKAPPTPQKVDKPQKTAANTDPVKLN